MASIFKRGSRYRVLIRKKGYPVICKSFSSRSSAETYAKEVEAQIERGVFEDHSPAESTPLSELIFHYREQILPSLKGKGTQAFRLNLLDSELGSYALSALTPFVVSRFRDQRLKVVKPATVKRELGVLSSLLTAGEKEFGIYLPHGNPVRRIRLPREPRGRDRRVSPEEEIGVLEAFGNNPIMRPLVIFALETAMRRTEIARMQWKEINWTAQTLSIPETKTDIPRNIPLSRKAVDTLKSLPRRIDGQVWGLKPSSISQAFRRACRKASIANLHFHDLRHEATSRLFEKGFNVMEVASITGHQDLRMLRRYTHIRAETLVSRL